MASGKKIRAQLKSGRGAVELVLDGASEPLATFVYSTHLAEWKWAGTKGRPKPSAGFTAAQRPQQQVI